MLRYVFLSTLDSLRTATLPLAVHGTWHRSYPRAQLATVTWPKAENGQNEPTETCIDTRNHHGHTRAKSAHGRRDGNWACVRTCKCHGVITVECQLPVAKAKQNKRPGLSRGNVGKVSRERKKFITAQRKNVRHPGRRVQISGFEAEFGFWKNASRVGHEGLQQRGGASKSDFKQTKHKEVQMPSLLPPRGRLDNWGSAFKLRF